MIQRPPIMNGHCRQAHVESTDGRVANLKNTKLKQRLKEANAIAS